MWHFRAILIQIFQERNRRSTGAYEPRRWPSISSNAFVVNKSKGTSGTLNIICAIMRSAVRNYSWYINRIWLDSECLACVYGWGRYVLHACILCNHSVFDCCDTLPSTFGCCLPLPLLLLLRLDGLPRSILILVEFIVNSECNNSFQCIPVQVQYSIVKQYFKEINVMFIER